MRRVNRDLFRMLVIANYAVEAKTAMRISIKESRHRLQFPWGDPVIVALKYGYILASARSKTSLIITTDSKIGVCREHPKLDVLTFVFLEDAKRRIIRTVVNRHDFEIEIRALHQDAIERLGDVLCMIVSDKQYAHGGVGCVGHWPNHNPPQAQEKARTH